MTLINFIYAHTNIPGFAIHKENSSVIWSREPLDGCDVYAYADAFGYRGRRSGIDVLMTFEPIVVLPGEYTEEVWQHFDYILTFVDSLAEKGEKFRKIFFPAFDWPRTKQDMRPIDLSYIRPLVEKKNAICMISGNKSSRIPGELYSKRLELAWWFSNHSNIPFDVYGRPPFELPNYRGELRPYSQKFLTLAEYRYSLCFENIYDQFWSKGYLSEKLLDCFMCGTVPIYLGCYNIEEYIPSECFIDFRQFKDYGELDRFLRSITDARYEKYVSHILSWVNEGNLRRYSMFRIYDRLLALAHPMPSEVKLATEPWRPGLAPDHAHCQWHIRKTPVIWPWTDLASARPSQQMLCGELDDTKTETCIDPATSRQYDNQDVPHGRELNHREGKHFLRLKNLKDRNHSLLPEFLTEMRQIFGAEVFVETGTFLGNTADAASKIFREVHTIELGRELYEAAKRRFTQTNNCHVHQGDSAHVLREILPRIRGKILFWLDAHYSEGITVKGENNTPILAELQAIKDSGVKGSIILIDDIRHFQTVNSDIDEGSPLYGYPSLQQVRDMVVGNENEYRFMVLGDTALIYPYLDNVFISPVIHACTVSRMFDGKDVSIDTVFDAENTIAAAQDQEREAIEILAKGVLAIGQGHVGGHYRLWYGLTLAKENRHPEACREFQQAIDRGCNHWRVIWYFAQAAYKAGRINEAQKAARAVAGFAPEFEEARVLLEQSISIQRWFRDKGDSTLRLDYPLTEDSLVFDVGGYTGKWSEQIVNRYNPYIYIFEPVPEYYSLIVERFGNNPKVSAFNFGLFNTTKTERIFINGDASSLYDSAGREMEISLVDIDEFLREKDIRNIDLVKINIEGAEYPLLKHMIDKGIVERCRDIQIQFHSFYPDAVKLRSETRDALRSTHSLTYDYPFVWENWRREASCTHLSATDNKQTEERAKTILLSYPRSGNTWLRYCIEFLTKRLTNGYEKGSVPLEGGLGKLVDMGVDRKKPPIVYKMHGHKPNEKDTYDMDNDRLILLLRNYKECIVRHHLGKGHLDRMFYSQTQGYRSGSLDYIGCLQIYEAWRGKKVLIYYEDLIRDPEPELVKVLDLLEVDKTHLTELMNNLHIHKEQCLYLYAGNRETRVNPSYTRGDPSKLLFHSQNLTERQKTEWDRHIAKSHPEITRKYLKRYQQSDVRKMDGVIGIIFSKDRAIQLDATLRSFGLHCKNSDSIDLKVLYTVSDKLHERQYRQLMPHYEFVEFIKENHFRQDVMSLFSSYPYVLFLVDDNIFVRDFCLADVLECLESNPDAIGFSLRLGKNTSYCYMLNTGQRLPDFDLVRPNVFKYNWTIADCDFAYPLELSSSVYRVSDLVPILTRAEFSNPNTLEVVLDKNKRYYEGIANRLLCYERSVTFCNPVNVVQTSWRNKSGTKVAYSSNNLARMFDEGYRIDVQKYSNMVPNACHQEAELSFIKSDPLTSIIILNFNGLQHVRACLESIKRNTPERHEIIIVDNASTDGSLNYLRNLPDITLVQNQTNLGCPPARAQAIALAGGDYVLLLDNDTVVTPGWLTTLLRHMKKNPEIGLLGPRSNLVSGPQFVPKVPYKDVQGLNLFAQKFSKHNQGGTTTTTRLVGFCMLIRREVIDRIGAPDPQFGKFGFEDDDYTWRAIIAGFQAAIAHDVFIHHTGGPQLRGDPEYNKCLQEAWNILKCKWQLPQELEYGTPYDVRKILSRAFDPTVHYIPIPDRSQLEPLIYRPADGSRDLKYPKTLTERVQPLLAAKRWKEAKEILESQLEKDFDDSEINFSLGQIAMIEKRFQEAERYFLKILHKGSKDPKVYNQLGLIYHQKGLMEKAQQYYDKALTVKNDYMEALLNKGILLQTIHRSQEAADCFNKCLDLDAHNHNIYTTVGYFHLNRGEKKEGLAYWKKSLELNPNQPELREVYQSISRVLESLI